MESIKELRRICQVSREGESFKEQWFAKHCTRGVSIYFTKFFLIIGASANQVTGLGFFIGIIAGVFLIFPNSIYWIIGALLLLLFSVLDSVDGEVARFRRSASAAGGFWDSVAVMVIWQYTLVCMSFGIYNAIHNVTVFIWCFLAIISVYLYNAPGWLKYPVLHEKELLPNLLDSPKSVENNGKTFIMLIIGLIRPVREFIYPTLIALVIVVLAIIDYYIAPVMIGSFSVDARYIYLTIFALAASAGAISSIYYTVHRQSKF